MCRHPILIVCTHSGLLVFKHGEAEKDITIEIIDDEVRVKGEDQG